MITAAEALERLKAGNRRFISGEGGRDLDFEHARRLELAEDQAPFAIVLGCSDSRVPSELVFDQGLGDLFVIRVAGNIAARTQLGSIEFAAEKFGTPLLVVLGHTGCGAVAAAVDNVVEPAEIQSPNLAKVVRHVRPAVETLHDTRTRSSRESLVRAAVGANVREVVERVKHDSAVLEKRIREGRLQVVGAEYSLETGEVSFFD